jgi:transcriptional regulator with XRE-family HTH domain
MYYENFEKLCKENKTNPSQVSKATGISTATLTSWKKGAYTPKQDKLQLIADHFKVSVDYIITGKESEFTIEMAETDVELSNMNKRLKEYAIRLNKLSNDKQEHIMQLIDMLEEKE